MRCKLCSQTISNEEHERVQDCFDDNYHELCFDCAHQEQGEDNYIRSHSYDVEVPFADNH